MSASSSQVLSLVAPSGAAPASHYREARIHVEAAPEDVFAYLDCRSRLTEPLGASFDIELGADEVLVERNPPRRKVWRTVGQPSLAVIDGYETGFEIVRDDEAGSRLRVWIDYTPAGHSPGRWAPSLAEIYANWCLDRVITEVAHAFSI